ncbi:MAG: SulP family inorganic anion transporter [Burkholderiales bacterium]|nr:SulP family inorganic anion transporter [Burkholderiales bacterium]
MNQDPTPSRLHWLPLLAVLRSYPRAWLRHDLVAGLSACVVMIPSVLAYAELVHLPPVTGLYAALAACVGYALFASSRQVIAGPDAAIGLLAGSVILPLAGGDPARMAVLAAELALLSGAVLLFAARLRLGTVADLLSRPVLVGYLNGASLLLLATQLGKLLGIRSSGDGFIPQLHSLAEQWQTLHLPTLLLGLALMALLAALTRWWPRVPGALAVCVVATVLSLALDLPGHGIAVVGAVPSGVPRFTLAVPQLADISALAPAALALAFLTFSDGILLAQTFAAKHQQDVNPNQELVALGSANILAALWQGFAVSASQTRTAVADANGARSQVAQLAAAAGLLVFLQFLTGAIEHLPVVALGAILLVTAAGMLEMAPLHRMLRIDRVEFGIAMGVTGAILLAGVVPGIILGLLVSLIAVLVEISRPGGAVLRRLPQDGKFHDCKDEDEGEHIPGLLVYRPYAPLIFANARHVLDRIEALADAAGPELRWLVIDAQAITDIDITAGERLAQLQRELLERGVALKFADCPRPLREQLQRLHALGLLPPQTFYVSVGKAVQAFEQETAATP